MRRRARRVAWIAVAALCGAGCDKHVATPVEPVSIDPVVEVSPAARSVRVALETEITATFSVDVDPRSITETTVFLKIDTRRYGYVSEYSAPLRRLTLRPLEELQVARTYTVEITPRVLRTDGTPLFPAGWKWQFTTTSVRPLRTPEPASPSTWVSPFMRLKWDATEASAGTAVYHLFTSADSAAVAERRVAAVSGTVARWVPRSSWPRGTPTFWAVRVSNLKTGEVVEGPVWRFETVPVDAPLDSSGALPALEWANASSTWRSCTGRTLAVGPQTTSAVRWKTTDLPNTDLRLARVDLELSGMPNFADGTLIELRAATETWTPCGVGYPGPPGAAQDVLARVARGTRGAYLFRGDAFTASIEAAIRDGDTRGYRMVTAQANLGVALDFGSPAVPGLGALKLVAYPPPPAIAR